MLLFFVSSALSDGIWYQIMPVPNAPECKVLANLSDTPIQRRFDKGGARIYAIGGTACPDSFSGNDEARYRRSAPAPLTVISRGASPRRVNMSSAAPATAIAINFYTFKLDAFK
jgi:hypothetical protein